MFKSGIKLGTIFGIKIVIDYSWFIIFFLVTWVLSFGFFPVVYNLDLSTSIVLGFITSILFFVSALIHELSHSVVAKADGAQIKRITLFLFGGIAHLTEEPKTAGQEFKMAIAGPLSSLILAFIFFTLSFFATFSKVTFGAVPVLETLAFLNFVLAIFNLLPGFPLDGGRVARAMIWAATHSFRKATFYASLSGRFIASLLIILGILEVALTGSFGGVWLVLVGLFLYKAAEASYKQIIFKDLLSDVEVKDLMVHESNSISSDFNLIDLPNRFLSYKRRSFFVTENDVIVGVVGVNQLKVLDEDQLLKLRVKDIMIKLDPESSSVNPHDSILRAFEIMNENRIQKLPVLKEKRFLGIISMNDIEQYLKIKSDLATEGR